MAFGFQRNLCLPGSLSHNHLGKFYLFSISEGSKGVTSGIMFEVLMVVKMSMTVFQVVVPCGSVRGYLCFNPDDGGIMFLWNVTTDLEVNTAKTTNIVCYFCFSFTDCEKWSECSMSEELCGDVIFTDTGHVY